MSLLLALQILPLLGAVLLGALPKIAPAGARKLAFTWSLLPLALLAAMAIPLAKVPGEWSFEWVLPWLPAADIQLRFAVNGLSGIFLVLTGLLTTFALATSFFTGPASRGFGALVLILESMLFGVFTARHFVPWFLCWELTLIPAYLLIRAWGGPKAPVAALRFFVVTLGGSVCMLAGFLVLQRSAATMDFDVLAILAKDGKLAGMVAETLTGNPAAGAMPLVLVAIAVFLGLAVKLPVVPLHAWLPAAYAEAPAPVSMLLTGVLSKMGVHGLLVVLLPIFPEVLPIMAPALKVLALATILAAAFAALAQTDLKKILAYSSINHLGYCLLAVAAVAAGTANEESRVLALSGVVLQAFNHGIIASTLFCLTGLLEARAHGARGLHDFGGLRQSMPAMAGIMGVAVFASLGLPALGGFVGEFLIFRGVFGVDMLAALAAVPALFVTALFLLRMYRLVFHGPLAADRAAMPDLGNGERAMLAVAVLMIILPGVCPQVLLHWLQGNPLLHLTSVVIP